MADGEEAWDGGWERLSREFPLMVAAAMEEVAKESTKKG